jgi:serine protease Do
MNGAVHLLEEVAASVVGIHASVPGEHPSVAVGLGADRRGSGTLISSDGLVLTVNYVVMGARKLIVTLTNGAQYDARIVAQDFTSNLALVRIDAHAQLPYLAAVSSKDCVLGQDAFIVASTGNEGRRADSGLVSYIGPFDALWEFVLERCVMVSAMNLGFGGAPVCNTKGQVFGVSYLSMAEVGRSVLAIPSECFLEARDELVSQGRRVSARPWAWLGLLSYTLREHVVVAGLLPGAPAEKAGLKQGDVILAIDGQGLNERRALYDALRSRQPGERVSLRIFRDNKVHTLEVHAIGIEDYFA